MNFYNNFVKFCNKAGKKPSAVMEEIGLSKSLVTRWKAGKGITDATAMKIAEYFGIDPAYLMYDADDVWDYYTKFEEDDDDAILEELQMVRDSPAIRSLLRSSKGLTEAQVEQVEQIVRQLRR